MWAKNKLFAQKNNYEHNANPKKPKKLKEEFLFRFHNLLKLNWRFHFYALQNNSVAKSFTDPSLLHMFPPYINQHLCLFNSFVRSKIRKKILKTGNVYCSVKTIVSFE